MNNHRIKAFLLSAGLGSRLRPLTDVTPKCLVDVGNQPVLGRWLTSLAHINCSSALINTHYLHQQVDDYLDSTCHMYDFEISSTYESDLLGTAGSLIKNIDFFDCDVGLLVHADNWMAENLSHFISAHQSRPSHCMLTMLTFHTNQPHSCGIVELDDQNVVTAFHEKSEKFVGNIANGAVYAFGSEFLDFVRNIKFNPFDFSKDIIPLLVNKIYTYQTDLPFVDIGTPPNLQHARSIALSHESF